MVVQHDDAEGARRSVQKSFLRARELRAPDSARLVPPGPDRIEPDHVEGRRRIGRLCRLPLSLEGMERTREAPRKGMGDVVIAWNRQHGPAEEREALGRWQRLSNWRKALAIGGFAIGTFGLGFTLGGLIFGRWRKA